ncbi:tyrosine-type recombinase/integrase [Cupriavidus nantongensis]|uniref:tyrosine-type recombinase/integrase n=1 Tax=Cupriavidus nantongensis TaxID=1796606 RepID=UPI00358F5EBE
MPVALPAGVRLRGSIFHLRIGVPKDIRHLWPSQSNGKPATDAYRASLGTADRNEAAARAHAIIAEYRRKFEEMRADSRPAVATPITGDLITYIVQKAERDVLALDDLLRSNPRYFADMARSTAPGGIFTGRQVFNEAWDVVGEYLDPEQYENASDIHRAIVRLLRTDLMVGRLDAARRVAEAACTALSIRVDWTKPQARMALQQILGAMVRAWQNVEKRDCGEPVETPQSPPVPIVAKPEAPEATPKTLRDVVPAWVARNAPKENAVGRTEKALALFEQAVGIVPLTGLTKTVGARFVDFLLAPERGWTRKTASNHAACITALANVAVKVDLLDRNPLDLSFDKTTGAKTREPWTDDELKRMLAHALFSDRMGETPQWQGVAQADGRAALLLLLHTGARIGEIAQLRKEDFQTRNGVVVIRISADAGTVKTQESERIVPLAGHLREDPWFAQWLQRTMGSTGPAFPSVCGRVRGPGDTLGQWFRQFRADAALPQGKLEGSHKFRHWLRSALAEKHVGEATMDSITGHSAQGSAGRKTYTKEASIRTMLDALDRISWPKIAK